MQEIVPLWQVRPPEMEEVLAHERSGWARELDWDYSATSALIARSVGAKAFAGYALREHGRVVAYCYLLAEPRKSLLGSVHALPEAERIMGASRLVDRALTHLVHESGTRRVESQFLFFGSDDPTPVFVRWGSVRFERQFLRGPLAEVLVRLGAGDGECPRAFRNSDIKAAASVVHQSFIGSIDALMSDCYATLDGCQAFVEGVLSRNGCGTYDPKASFVSIQDGRPAGIVLASRLSARSGHIVQISVAPAAQRRGTGRRLLRAAAEALLRRGFSDLSLSVSVENARARAWYLSLGLRPVKDFSAFVWEKGEG